MDLNHPKVALSFFEDRAISTYPSVLNTARILSEHGYNVDLFVPSCMIDDTNIKNVRIISSGDGSVPSYIKHVSRMVKNKYDVLIAFSIEGLFVGSIINKFCFNEMPVIYFSMELIYKNYFVNSIRKTRSIPGVFTLKRILWYFHLKSFGKYYVKFGIAQDDKRADLLREEFHFIKDIVIVPNSYIGFDNSLASQDIRKRFNISADRKILLFAGGMHEGLGTKLFSVMKELDSAYVFFANVYCRDEYINKIKGMFSEEIKEGKIIVNDKNLNESDHLDLVKSSYLGVVWYSKIEKSNENMYFIGMSSGKLNRFLSCGVPVILPDYFPGFVDLIAKCDVGELCEDETTIPEAIHKIEKKHDLVSVNIKRYYLENLEFGKNFHEVLKMIEKL